MCHFAFEPGKAFKTSFLPYFTPHDPISSNFLPEFDKYGIYGKFSTNGIKKLTVQKWRYPPMKFTHITLVIAMAFSGCAIAMDHTDPKYSLLTNDEQRVYIGNDIVAHYPVLTALFAQKRAEFAAGFKESKTGTARINLSKRALESLVYILDTLSTFVKENPSKSPDELATWLYETIKESIAIAPHVQELFEQTMEWQMPVIAQALGRMIMAHMDFANQEQVAQLNAWPLHYRKVLLSQVEPVNPPQGNKDDYYSIVSGDGKRVWVARSAINRSERSPINRYENEAMNEAIKGLRNPALKTLFNPSVQEKERYIALKEAEQGIVCMPKNSGAALQCLMDLIASGYTFGWLESHPEANEVIFEMYDLAQQWCSDEIIGGIEGYISTHLSIHGVANFTAFLRLPLETQLILLPLRPEYPEDILPALVVLGSWHNNPSLASDKTSTAFIDYQTLKIMNYICENNLLDLVRKYPPFIQLLDHESLHNLKSSLEIRLKNPEVHLKADSEQQIKSKLGPNRSYYFFLPPVKRNIVHSTLINTTLPTIEKTRTDALRAPDCHVFSLTALDDNYLAAATTKGIYIYAVGNPKPIQILPYKSSHGAVCRIVALDDSHVLINAESSKIITLLHWKTADEVRRFEMPSNVGCMVKIDNTNFAVTIYRNAIYTVNWQTGKNSLIRKEQPITSWSSSPYLSCMSKLTNDHIIAGLDHGRTYRPDNIDAKDESEIEIWSTQPTKALKPVSKKLINREIQTLCKMNENSIVYTPVDDKVYLFDIPSGTQTKLIDLRSHGIGRITGLFRLNNEHVLVKWKDTLLCINSTTGKKIGSIKNETGATASSYYPACVVGDNRIAYLAGDHIEIVTVVKPGSLAEVIAQIKDQLQKEPEVPRLTSFPVCSAVIAAAQARQGINFQPREHEIMPFDQAMNFLDSLKNSESSSSAAIRAASIEPVD